MEFDVILTNPPFQDAVNRNKTPHKLWIDFTLATFDRLLADGGSLVQVSPASFSSPSNVVLDLFQRYRTNVIRLGTGHHFPEIGSSFSDYWITKEPHDGAMTRVVTASGEFTLELDEHVPYLPNDFGPASFSIHQKVMFSDRARLPVQWDYVTCHNIRRHDDPPSLVTEPSPDHPFPVFHTNRSTWWSSRRQDWADHKKVMWTRSGYTKPFYDPGELGGTDMVYFVVVDSDEEGRALAHNLSSLLLRYILKTAKWSGFGNERVFSRLPELPRDEALDDEAVFDLFALTEEEIDHVRTAMAPRRGKAR